MAAKESEIEDKIIFLKEFSYFSGLNQEKLMDIAKLLETMTYNDGQPLFFQGDRGDRVYFLIDGMVKAVKSNLMGVQFILKTWRVYRNG